MSDNPGQQVGEVTSESLSIPDLKLTSAPSTDSDVRPEAPEFDDVTLGKLADLVAARVSAPLRESLLPDIKSAAQSVKDVRFKPLEGMSGSDLRAIVDLVKKHNDDVEAARDELGLKAWREERDRERAKSPAQVTQPAPASSDDKGMSKEERESKVLEALSEFGYDQKSNQAIIDAWGTGEYSNFDTALVGLKAIAKLGGGTPAAEAAPTGAGLVAPAATGVALKTEKAKEAEIAGLNEKMGEYFKNPSKYAAEIKAAKDSLRSLGIDYI